jgi:hypothetical protein
MTFRSDRGDPVGGVIGGNGTLFDENGGALSRRRQRCLAVLTRARRLIVTGEVDTQYFVGSCSRAAIRAGDTPWAGVGR